MNVPKLLQVQPDLPQHHDSLLLMTDHSAELQGTGSPLTMAVPVTLPHWHCSAAGPITGMLLCWWHSPGVQGLLGFRMCLQHWCTERTHPNTFPKKMHFSAQEPSAADVCWAVWPELSDSLHTGHPAAAGW